MWFRNNNGPIDNNSPSIIKPNKKQIAIVVFKWLLAFMIIGIILFFIFFGIDLNARVFLKKFLLPPKPVPEPLSQQCLSLMERDAKNTKHYGLIPSIPVTKDDVCFDYAGLIQPNGHNRSQILFHTFWSTSLGPELTESQLASLRSFAATQPTHAQLIVWIPSHDKDALLQTTSRWHAIPNNQQIRYRTTDHQQQPETIRLDALHDHGGVWFELDQIWVRDMSPILNQEWMAEDGPWHFFRESGYLCEIRRGGRVYERVLAHPMRPWAVLPWCFLDPFRYSVGLGRGESGFDQVRLGKVFAVRLMGVQGSVFRYLVDQHKQKVDW